MTRQPTKNSPDKAAMKDLVKVFHRAYPTWTYARIGAACGVSKTTVFRYLHDDVQQHQPDTQPMRKFGEPRNSEQLTIEAIEKPSKEFGTANQTASIIAERDAIAELKIAAERMAAGARRLGATLPAAAIAAKEVEYGARKVSEAADHIDALLKQAFVKGTQAAQTLKD